MLLYTNITVLSLGLPPATPNSKMCTLQDKCHEKSAEEILGEIQMQEFIF
jgi:hypothetical protein